MISGIKRKLESLLLSSYKNRVRKKHNPTLDHCLKTIRKMMKKSKYCFLITNSNRDWPSARMVQQIVDFDKLEIWLGTNPRLRKVKEIKDNPNVTITFGSERENANLVVYGKVTLESDLRERVKHWIGSWKLFFPNGPRGADFISIRIKPHEIELMNFKRYLVPEPFGLNPIKLINNNGQWEFNNGN